MRRKSLFGSLLAKVQWERHQAKEQAGKNLLERNGITSPKQREGYRLVEQSIITRDGAESTEIRLWKLIDKEVVVLSTDIATEYRAGLDPDDKIRQEDDKSGDW